MNVYTSNILAATVAFPFIAALVTVPYLVYQYRKFGSVPWLRTLVVYSFVFYLLCAYFLVLLPLPADRTAFVPYAATPQLVPFHFVSEIAQTARISADPASWLGFARTPAVYEAFFNLLLTMPFGMYLRYYFRRSWWQVLLLGFCLTLSFETLQLTGLLGLYEHPYRLFDVDDLIVNTLGAMAGFWLVGPALRVLPDMRLVNAEAREAGVHAGVTRRALSFGIDRVPWRRPGRWRRCPRLARALAGPAVLRASRGRSGGLPDGTRPRGRPCTAVGVRCCSSSRCPPLTRGQTPGQKLLRLRIVRPDARQAGWYQYAGRYGLLFLFAWAPFAALFGLTGLDPSTASEAGALAAFAASHQQALAWAWLAFMGAWAVTLAVRALRSALLKRPFVMLNGLLSNTRVMTCAAVERERERRHVLDVAEVAALERTLAEAGTPLSELMARAGAAVAEAVRTWVPDPSPVVVLAGAGNNGGDGWVAARLLAQAGYPVTLVTPDLAERLHAEPARTTAQGVFAEAAARKLPLRVLVAPDADVLSDAVDGAQAVVDAMLGTGFSGDEVRAPYAGWIEAANRRRFEGARRSGRGRHRKRLHEQGDHVRGARRALPRKAKDAPFAVAVDVPSGLSAQTGAAARPCFAADVTVTMLAFKPGLVVPAAARWTGAVRLAKLEGPEALEA